MLGCIKESFKLTNKYIILATPLIIFSLLSSLYILFSSHGSLINLMIALVLFTLMVAAFISGWFFMIRKCIKEPEIDEPVLLIKDFPEGVGEYFLSALGLIFCTFIISTVFILLSYFLGMKFIGSIGISSEILSKSMESFESLKAMLLSLNETQLLKLNAWNLLLFGTMSLTYFLVMFYVPAMFFKEKNPLKAYLVSLKDLFSRKFFKNLLLFLILLVSYFIISIFTTIFGLNILMHFVFTLINFYYLVFISVLICYYYYINYVKCGQLFDRRV